MNVEASPRGFARLVLLAAGLGAGVTVVVLLIWSLAEVWLLMFAGLIFAVFLRAVTNPLSRRLHFHSALAYATTILFVLALMVVTMLLFVPLFWEAVAVLMEQFPENMQRISDQLDHYAWGQDLRDQINRIDWSSYTAGTLSRLAGFFSTALGAISAFVLVMITGFYLAADPAVYTEGTLGLVPPRARPRAQQILEALRRALEWWLVGRFVSMLVIGVLTWIALFALGIPLAATLAFIAGVLSFIPNVGPILSAIPAVLIGAGISPMMGLYVILVFVVVQIIESYFITPMVTRRTINLPPATVLIMQIAFTVLYGFLGLLLATPLTVVLMVIINTIYVEDILGESASLS